MRKISIILTILFAMSFIATPSQAKDCRKLTKVVESTSNKLAKAEAKLGRQGMKFGGNKEQINKARQAISDAAHLVDIIECS